MKTKNLKRTLLKTDKPHPQCGTCGKRLWKWKDRMCREHMDYSFRKGMNMGHPSSLKGTKLNLTEEQLQRRREIIAARPKKEPSHCLDCNKPLTNRKSLRCSKCNGKSRIGFKLSEEAKQKLRDWHVAHPNKIFQDTSIELAIQDELADRQIIFIKQFVFEGVARVDFYLPEYDIVVQCDGCYWHNCIEHYPEHNKGQRQKDITKDAKLSIRGVKVFRFWEHDIKRSVQECINKLDI